MDKKKPSLFGRFFGGLASGDKVTSKEIQEAEGIVRRDPSNLRALHKLGDLYAKAEQDEKAIETYIRAADSYIERAFYQKAVAVYKQILKIRPNMHDVQERLAEVYIELGRRSDALAQYQNLARKYEGSGAISLATEMLLKMLTLDEENVPLRVKLAELHLAMSESKNAVLEFEKALNTLAQQENWADYIKVGERLLFVAPDHLGALKTISRVYLDTGDVMKAMGKLQQAFKLDRRDPETLEVLAVAFDRLEQPEKTISVLKELAEIYKDLGQFDYVRDVYQQILERDPHDKEIHNALENLPGPSSRPSHSALPAAASRPSLPSLPASPSRSALPAVPSRPSLPAIPAAPRTPPPIAPPPPPPPVILSPPPSPPPVPEESAAVDPSLSLTQEELERLLNEAEVYIKYGLVPRVEEALNRIFAAEPHHPQARRLKVELLKMQERAEEAAHALLQLAQEEEDPTQALAYLEQILELEEVPPSLQEEAYQLTIRLRPKSGTSPGIQGAPPPSSLPDSASSSGEYIPKSEELEIVSMEELESIHEIDAVESDPDDLIVIEEDSSAPPSIGEFTMLDVSGGRPSTAQEEPSHTAPQTPPHFAPLEPTSEPPKISFANFEEEDPLLQTQISPETHSVEELSIVDLEEMQEDANATPPELPAVPPPPPVFQAPPKPPLFSPPPGPPVFEAKPPPGPPVFEAKSAFDTKPAFEAKPPAFPRAKPTFPGAPSPEDDPFSKFLSKKTQDEELHEEDEGFHDFLQQPLVVETDNKPEIPTRSEFNDELSEMEAAAERLRALIRAKEREENSDSVVELVEEVQPPAMLDIPPPFSTPVPAEIPPPFAPEPPDHSLATPPDAMLAHTHGTDEQPAFPMEDTNPSAERDAVPTPQDPFASSYPPPTSLQAPPTDPFHIPSEEEPGLSTYVTSHEQVDPFAIQEEPLSPISAPASFPRSQTIELTETLDEEEGSPFGGDDFSFEEMNDAFEEISEPTEEPPLALDPADPFTDELHEARFYLEQDEPQYAIEIFDRILQQDPNHELARSGLEIALEAERELQLSAQEEDFLFDLDSALGLTNATARERERMKDELKAFKEEAQKQFGEDAEASYELGMAYMGMALNEMAIEAFQNCLRVHYRELDCYKLIGNCYSAQAQATQAPQAFKHALNAYQSALELPNIHTDGRLDVLFEIGDVYELSGNPRDAMQYFQEVQQIDPNYRGVRERIDRLRSVLG